MPIGIEPVEGADGNHNLVRGEEHEKAQNESVERERERVEKGERERERERRRWRERMSERHIAWCAVRCVPSMHRPPYTSVRSLC